MDIMSPDVFPTGVLYDGRFVGPNALSFRTFCPWMLCFWTFSLGHRFFALNTTYFKKKNFTFQRATFEIKNAFQKIFLESFANPKLYQRMAIFENFVKITVP
jgi:hypothetical protein